MDSNMNAHSRVDVAASLSGFLQALSSPSRLEIILAIGTSEACVCHLEAVLGQRQAYISQHLMALRDAGLIINRREGRYIYYRLRDPKILGFLRQAAVQAGISGPVMDRLLTPTAYPACSCPKCQPELISLE
jgi:ArsR family transcriptional regulator